MSRKTTARRGAAAVLAVAVLSPGFALGIAEAAPTDPAVSGLSTTAVPLSAAPGTLTITGKNFGGADLVRLTGPSTVDIADTDFFIVSPTKIVVKLPDLVAASAAAGVYNVLVRGADGSSFSADSVRDNLKVSAAGTVASSSAAKVPALGGAKIRLTGTNLLGTSKVTVDGAVAKIDKVTDTTLDITTPPVVVGAGKAIAVTTPFGAATVTPTLESVAVVSRALPTTVDPAGGTVVTVNGAGLLAAASNGDVAFVVRNAAGAVVARHDVDATDFVAVSQVELTVRVPAVLAANGTPNYTGASAASVVAGSVVELVVEGSDALPGYKPVKVTYAPLPNGALASGQSLHHLDASPSTREWHNVTVNGQNLAGGIVRVNGILVPTVSSSASSLVFKTVRQGAAAGPWNVTVTTVKGSKTVGTLTYSPVVTVTPTTALASSAGEDLYLAGTGFKALSGAGAVSGVFNGGSATNLTYLAVSDSLLKVTVPAGTTGTVNELTITPPADFGAVDTVALSYRGPITITDTTKNVPAAGGDVTFTGSGFSALSGHSLTVVINGASVTVTPVVTDNTTLTITFPAGTAAHTGTLVLTPQNGYGLADEVALTVV